MSEDSCRYRVMVSDDVDASLKTYFCMLRANRASSVTIRRVRKEFEDAMRNLSHIPFMHPVDDDAPTRSFVVGVFRIYYSVDESNHDVYVVWAVSSRSRL